MGWLPEFLDKHLADLDSARKVLYWLCKVKLHDIMSTLEPDRYQSFLYQLGIPEHKYKYDEKAHGSNVEHKMRIRIASMGNYSFLGM